MSTLLSTSQIRTTKLSGDEVKIEETAIKISAVLSGGWDSSLRSKFGLPRRQTVTLPKSPVAIANKEGSFLLNS